MELFRDNQERKWELRLNVSMARKVRDETKHNLLDLKEQTIDKLINDAYLLVDILWVLCEEQAKVKVWTKNEKEIKGVSAVEFGEGLAGETIDNATEALLNEIVNFLPNPRQREIFSNSLKMIKKVMDRTYDKVEKVMSDPKLTEAVEKEVDEKLNTLLNISSGMTQES